MKLIQVANFINFFGVIVIYAAMSVFPYVLTQVMPLVGINYAEKSFMKLRPGVNVIKLFFFVTDDKAK